MNFARSVKETNPIFFDADAATAAGFDAMPATPTYLMGASSWGSYPEQQPADPGSNPMVDVVVEYSRQGGLLLHGEQSFAFERPIKVGDVLDVETEIVETYEKGSLTFTIAETRYTDADSGELVATARSNMINRQ